MEKKMTKAEVFTKASEVILSQIDNVENAEFIAEVLVKEAARTKKTYARQAGYDTKAQKENKHMAALVINFFLKDADPEVAYSATEVAEAANLGEVSSQKMTAILKLAAEVVDKKDSATNSAKHKGYQTKVLG